MDFVQNFPFFSIILSMFSGTVSSVLPAKAAKWLNTVVIGAVGCCWCTSWVKEPAIPI